MKFHWLRKTFLGGLLATLTAVLLGSCGGGGAAIDNTSGGTMAFLPPSGTFYAGIPQTIRITGGRGPYLLSSSEPGLMAVPSSTSGTFTVVPNNPGVIDSGLSDTELPRRTVNITARDQLGGTVQAAIQVGQNFLTGYGIRYASNCPSVSGATPSFCAGGETVVGLSAVFNGNLAGNRQFRLEILRGPVAFVFPGTNNTVNTVTTVSDHTGFVTTIIRVAPNVPTQIGVIRVVDVATGVYADYAFIINATGPASPALTAVPSSFTFTAATDRECGTGIGEFLVFGGVAPFTAVSSSPDVIVRRVGGSGDQPGRFEVRANNPGICLENATVIVTDATGARTTVTVTTNRGEAVEIAPLTVAPATLTLGCGQGGSVTVVGGTGSYSVATTSAAINAVTGGNTVTITRLTGDGLNTYPTTATVSVTDGGRVATVAVTIPANCP